MWKNHSFAFRLTLTGSILTLVGMLVAIFINSLISYTALEEEVRERSMPALVEAIESEFTEHLAMAHGSLQYFARWPQLVQWIENGENPEEFKDISEMCQSVVELFRTGSINIVIDRSGRFYEAVNLPPPTIKPLDPVVDKWFYDFKAAGRKILTNLHAPGDPGYGGMAFVNARIEDRQGRFLGVVGAPFDMSGFEELLKTGKIGKLGRTFVVRADGTVLLHTYPERIYQHLEDLPGFKGMAEQALKQKEKFFQVRDEAGRKLLVGSAPLHVMDGFIFTVADEQELFADIIKARNYSLLAALIVLAVTIIAGIRISRQLSRPMQHIIEFAGKVAANTASEPMPQEGTKEMCAMVDALNDMNIQLRRSNLSLKSVRRIFDGLAMSLMVTVPESGEILYSNARQKKDFGLEADPAGRKCWEVLYSGKTAPCADCSAKLLARNPEAVVRKEVRSSVNGRLYEEICSFIDWIGDSKAMLVQRLDITEAAVAKQEQQQRLAQLQLALTISQSLVSTEPATTLIGNAISNTGAFMEVGRLRVMRYDEKSGRLICEHEWLNPADAQLSLLGKSLPFGASHPLYIKSFIEFAAHIEVRDTAALPGLVLLPAAGVRSFVDVPIYVDGKLWGFIGADNCHGPHVWSEADIRMLRLVSGMLSSLILRRTAESSLLRMTSLVEEATQYITYVNRNGEFQYFNNRTCDLLGYSAEELSAGGLALIFSEATMAYVRKNILPGIVREGRLSFELPVVRKDGVRRIFSFEAFSIGSGEDVGLGAIGRDVTEKKILEDELLDAKDAAEKSSRAKSAFLSRMSHEMRTPLNAVMGMASIGLRTDKAEKARDCLEKITDAARHLLGMINEILDMSNIEADRFALKPKEFILETLISKTTDRILPLAEKKDQVFTVEIAPGLPRCIIADEQRLGQIMGHLLSNAVKFTPEKGRIDLSVRMVEETAEQCLIELSVADTGVGIPKEHMERLFTPFEQADGGDARKFGGTGLGLALSRKIVNLMGGRIDAVSNDGQGTVFTVTLSVGKGRGLADALETRPEDPAPETENAAAGAPEAWTGPLTPQAGATRTGPETPAPVWEATVSAQPPAISESPATGASAQEGFDNFSAYRILLAEDVEINREIVIALLEPTGVTIDCAENGKEAVAAFTRNPGRYHLIFMDINMPEMDGYEAVSRIRSSGLEEAANIPIIAMTANAFSEDINKCLEAGMNGHLAKPIEFDQLTGVMRKYLGHP